MTSCLLLRVVLRDSVEDASEGRREVEDDDNDVLTGNSCSDRAYILSHIMYYIRGSATPTASAAAMCDYLIIAPC